MMGKKTYLTFHAWYNGVWLSKGRDQKMAIYAPLQKCKFVLLPDWGIFPQYNKLYFMMISLILVEKWQVLLPWPHSIYKILPILSFYCLSKYFILTVNLHEFVKGTLCKCFNGMQMIFQNCNYEDENLLLCIHSTIIVKISKHVNIM